jgi:phospholipid/cholesterol/gamma-HCH transport system substrate-binding protein
LADDTLIRQAEQTVAVARERIADLAPTIAQLNDATRRADTLIERMGSEKEGLPSLIRRADASLQNLQSVSRDMARAGPRLPEIASNVASSAAELPALLTQIQITAADLEQLVTQLRSLWLLGGSNTPPPQTRLPATRLQP